MALEITEQSHLDHGVSDSMIQFILDKFKDKNEFFIETINVPGGAFDNALYGPSEGDAPVSEDEVYYETRNNRPGKSRMIKRPFRKTNKLTVIAGPAGDKPCVLYTCYGGSLAPREPFDSALVTDELLNESRDFWATHALGDGSSVSDVKPEIPSKSEDFIGEEFESTAKAKYNSLLKKANKSALTVKNDILSVLSDLSKITECDPEDEESLVGSIELVISDEDDLERVYQSLIEINQSINELKNFIEEKAQSVSGSDLDELAELADSLDETGDPELMRKASVIDEILITIGANPKAQMAFKKAEDEEIERLRAKYRDQERERLYSSSGDEKLKKEKEVSEKQIKDNVKKFRPLEAPLSTRYSPDMPGVSLMRIGEGVYQCPVTKKIYDFNNGYTTAKGNKIPGTSVSGQTDLNNQLDTEHQMFSSRESILNGS